MPDLSTLTAAGSQSEVLPGYTIKPFTLAALGEVERELCRRHIDTAASAAVGIPAMQEKIIAAATKDVASGIFDFGSEFFDRGVFAASMLPFLLYTSLKMSQSKMTPRQAKDLLTIENEAVIRKAVMQAMGYGVARKNDEGAEQAPPSGQPSSPPSENEESPGATSDQ